MEPACSVRSSKPCMAGSDSLIAVIMLGLGIMLLLGEN